MRAVVRCLAGVAIIAILGACSINPRPEDVTGYEPRSISRIFRCQARNALRGEIIAYFRDVFGELIAYKNWSGYRMAEWLASDPQNFTLIEDKYLQPRAKIGFEMYGRTLISWDFTVDATEKNSAGANLTFLKQFTRGSDALGIKVSNDRTRQAKQQNRNYDSFGSLVRHSSADFCRNVPETINVLYPSTGTVRIDALIHDFIAQNQYENLGAKAPGFNDAELNATFVFTTRFDGNFDPDLKLNSAPGVYVPSEIKLNTDNYREDIHTVIVLLQLPAKPNAVTFDQFGRITSAQIAAIDAKFEEIRQNNFRDDFRRAAVVRINP